MLEDGLSYPVRGDWIGRIAIGGILGFLSIFIVPILAISGYSLDVIRQTVAGEDEPPEWENWGDLVVDGLKVAIVSFVYSIVPIAVIFGLGIFFLGLGSAAGDAGGGFLAGFGFLTFLLLIPVMFVVYYLVPAALANMAIEGNLGAAFDVGTMQNVVLTSDYFLAVLMPIVVGIAINVVASFLAFTIVGLLFVPFLSFYGQVAVFRMFGTAFANTSDKVGEASSPPMDPTPV